MVDMIEIGVLTIDRLSELKVAYMRELFTSECGDVAIEEYRDQMINLFNKSIIELQDAISKSQSGTVNLAPSA